VLDNLRGEHPIIEKILEFRQLTKLKGTYVDALPALINPRTGRVHTSFNQTGASTGRMSSSNPNLQNIPIRSEMGREIRKGFIVPPGYKLLSVDYSQVELRILAHLTGDTFLIDSFRQGLDIHAATAAVVAGVPIEQVTKTQRIFAKRVNFGVLYGMSAFRLTRESGLPIAEAQKFIDNYFERLPNVQRYIKNTIALAKVSDSYLCTLFGRRRRFPGLRAGNRNEIAAAEREAINMPIQGTAADIIKKAMITLDREVRARGLGAKMLLQVHDELVFEVPEGELRDSAALIVETMEQVIELRAPLKANASAGDNWLDVEDIE
jgi:DNA polymerase-1